MSLPVISKGTIQSVFREVDLDLNDPKITFQETITRMFHSNKELLRVAFNCSKELARDTEERRKIASAFLLTYRLLQSQIEANQLQQLLASERPHAERYKGTESSIPKLEGGPT